MMKYVPESSGPIVVWIVTPLTCPSKSPSQSSQSMQLPFSHFKTWLGDNGTYTQILELRSSLESTTLDNETLSMLVS